MARLHHLDTVVLVRPKTTTTYHFGLVTPICERTPTEGEAAPEPVPLVEAVGVMNKRLCNECAELVSEWTRAALTVARELDLEHPAK